MAQNSCQIRLILSVFLKRVPLTGRERRTLREKEARTAETQRRRDAEEKRRRQQSGKAVTVRAMALVLGIPKGSGEFGMSFAPWTKTSFKRSFCHGWTAKEGGRWGMRLPI